MKTPPFVSSSTKGVNESQSGIFWTAEQRRLLQASAKEQHRLSFSRGLRRELLALLVLRASFGMFKDLKDLVYLGPFVAITGGLYLSTLATPTRLRKLSAAAVAAGLIAFSLEKHAEYLNMHVTLAP